MKRFTLEEFTSKRRSAQTRIEKALHPTVTEAVDLGTNTSGWDELLDAVEEQYRIAYHEDASGTVPPLPQGWKKELRTTLRETTSPRTDRTVNNISVWLATWVLSQASIAAANTDTEDLLLEWVDMGDSNVRAAHAKTAGQQRPPGEPFDVDGVKMDYPGDPSAPIELWINCRCTLRPVLADEFRGTTASMGHTESDTGGTMTDAIPEVAPEDAQTPIEQVAMQWHGVLAPEDTRSGDGRKFAAGSLIARPTPLPLTWQRASADGHGGSVTVAKIERLTRVGNEIRGMGSFIINVEADEVVGLIGEFGHYGVSIDADDVAFELDEATDTITFTKGRVASASIVSIPAFSQAWVALGEAPADFFDGGADLETEGAVDESLVASTTFVDVSPGITEDGPGWLTHPVDTDRLRDYWVRGEGAAKIGWGTPGDFNRCRVNLSKYVKPEYLSGYCANRHFDALGFWPGRPVAGDTAPFAGRDGQAAPAWSIVASTAAAAKAPYQFFVDPGFAEPTHLTVTEEGEVFGHIAAWGVCHSKWTNECVLPPHSLTDYAYFATGQVLTDKGMVNTGPLTIGGAHAAGYKRLRPALAHYENTTAAVADVAIGEDDHGVWVHGWVRPGTTPEQVAALRASDVSGDWRWSENSKSMELIAALGVNSGGFHTPRVAAAFEGGQQISLVAAGYLPSEGGQDQPLDLTAFSKTIAEHVAKELTARSERKTRMDELAAQLED